MRSLKELQLKLGQTTEASELDPIPRALGRQHFEERGFPFFGYDLWNAYEASFLLPSQKPMVYHLQVRYDASSPNIVESKSFKLYLMQFNNQIFKDLTDFSQKITKDLNECVGGSVHLSFFEPNQSPGLRKLPGRTLDNLEPEKFSFHYSPDLLLVNQEPGAFAYHSHLLRSNCPVTNQPDWGSLIVSGSGPRTIDPTSLLTYLVSFRNRQDFHETCCEHIFLFFYFVLNPDFLEVQCCYTRRGGLDINPLRTTLKQHLVQNQPVWRQ